MNELLVYDDDLLLLLTEYWTDKMEASRFFLVATHSTTAKIKNKNTAAKRILL